MNPLRRYLLLAIALVPARAAEFGSFPKTQGMPWPMPKVYDNQYNVIQVDNSLDFNTNLADCDIILQAFDRYRSYVTSADCAKGKLTFSKSPPVEGESKLTSLNVIVAGECEKWPSSSSNEQYNLTVNNSSSTGEALIQANTVWGALRGLETFSQLVYSRGDGVLRVNWTEIFDAPRFSFRSLLLDTSRHFLPVSRIEENLELMAQNKFNVFHWHIVDDQSFPYVSKAFPRLSEKGAYSPKHVYTPQDVARVIEFARVRGIRVIPEFDTPGHTKSWWGQPDLLTPCFEDEKPNGMYGPVNPVVESTYTFLRGFYANVASDFPDEYVHLGGDEVYLNGGLDCWESNPDVMDFMKKSGMRNDFSRLQEYYMLRLTNITAHLGKKSIVWQELYDIQANLNKEVIINVWKPIYHKVLADVTKVGYKVVLTSPWYLNYISYGVDWTRYYKTEPYNFTGNDDQKERVLGGGVCMWGEYVDATNVVPRTWPRASAVAERLWSPQYVNDPDAAAPRLEEHRCRMMKRGFMVQPVNGPSSCDCDIFN